MFSSPRLLAVLCVLAGLGVAAPAAMADARYNANFNNDYRGASAFFYDSGATGSHTYRLDLVRNGAVLASSTSSFPSAGVTVPNKGLLEAADRIGASQDFSTPDVNVEQSTLRQPAASCPPPAPPTVIVLPPSAAQIFAALQGALGQAGTKLNGTDLATVLKKGFVDLPFAFLVGGKLDLSALSSATGARSAQAAKAKRHKKVVTL